MDEGRPDEVHEAIAREIEREDREEFFKWLERNKPSFAPDTTDPEQTNEAHPQDDRYDWVKEEDDTTPMSGESPRHRGLTVDDCGEPNSLY